MNELQEILSSPGLRQVGVGAIAGLLGLVDGVRERFDNSGKPKIITGGRYIAIPFCVGIIESVRNGTPLAGDYGIEIASDLGASGLGYFAGLGAVRGLFRAYDSFRVR